MFVRVFQLFTLLNLEGNGACLWEARKNGLAASLEKGEPKRVVFGRIKMLTNHKLHILVVFDLSF